MGNNSYDNNRRNHSMGNPNGRSHGYAGERNRDRQDNRRSNRLDRNANDGLERRRSDSIDRRNSAYQDPRNRRYDRANADSNSRDRAPRNERNLYSADFNRSTSRDRHYPADRYSMKEPQGNRQRRVKADPIAEENYRREARAAAEARRRNRNDSRSRTSILSEEEHQNRKNGNRGSSPRNRFESALHDGRSIMMERTEETRARAKHHYEEIDKSLGGIISTKVILIALAVMLLFAVLSLGVRFAAGLVKPGGDKVDNVAAQIQSRADSCKLSEKDVVSRLEAVGVEDTWADKAGTLSQTDARFQTMAQLNDSLGREGAEVTNKMVKLAVNDPEAVDYVVGFITKYPQKNFEPYTESVNKGTVPQLYQWDQRWAYLEYSGTTFGCTGCGPTALSMTYMGVTGNNDMCPGDMAKLANSDGYETANEGTMNQYFVEEAQGLGMTVDVLDVEAKALTEALKDGKVVICNVGPGDFTDYGHFIVIAGLTQDGDLKINDPFSSVNSAKSWDIDEVINQAVALYAYDELN